MRSHESAHQLRPVVVVSCSKLREALLDRLVDRLALGALALGTLLSSQPSAMAEATCFWKMSLA